MARQKTSPLAIKAKRLALPIAKRPVFDSLGDGVSIGYRRNNGAGVWVARRSDGKGGKVEGRLGLADDYRDPDGNNVLSYAQACAAAFTWEKPVTAPETGNATDGPLTLRKVLNRYEADLKVRGGDAGNVARVRHHLPESLLTKPVAEMKVGDLREWRDKLAETLAPSSVNRTCTPVKAALNAAADADEGETIKSRAPWEIGLKTLSDADEARNVILSAGVVAKIVRAAYTLSDAFGMLVESLAVTGSRYSQLARLKVEDVQGGSDPRLMVPTSAKGKGQKKARNIPVPIPTGLARRLKAAGEGRPGNAPLLVKPSGGAWSKSDHSRPFARAVSAADLKAEEIEPYTIEEVTAYALRHSAIVRQLLAGVPMRVVAALCDTSVTMIERTYSKHIAHHADAVARAAMLDVGDALATPAPKPAANGRDPMDGACKHGHSYREFPPYRNATGSVVCAECARLRTAKNKAAKRSGLSNVGR